MNKKRLEKLAVENGFASLDEFEKKYSIFRQTHLIEMVQFEFGLTEEEGIAVTEFIVNLLKK